MIRFHHENQFENKSQLRYKILVKLLKVTDDAKTIRKNGKQIS